MDLRVYYEKVRQIESGICEPWVVVVSLQTPDGGREGVRTEVSRSTAARMVADAKARLATREEAGQYRETIAEEKREAEQTAAANRMQITVVSEAELKALKRGK